MKDLSGKEVFDGDLVYVFYSSSSTVVMQLAIVVGRTNTLLKIFGMHQFPHRETYKPEKKSSNYVLKISPEEALSYAELGLRAQPHSDYHDKISKMIEFSKQMLNKE